MDVKDIVMEPGQVAVLLWMYREDAYNASWKFGGTIYMSEEMEKQIEEI